MDRDEFLTLSLPKHRSWTGFLASYSDTFACPARKSFRSSLTPVMPWPSPVPGINPQWKPWAWETFRQQALGLRPLAVWSAPPIFPPPSLSVSFCLSSVRLSLSLGLSVPFCSLPVVVCLGHCLSVSLSVSLGGFPISVPPASTRPQRSCSAWMRPHPTRTCGWMTSPWSGTPWAGRCRTSKLARRMARGEPRLPSTRRRGRLPPPRGPRRERSRRTRTHRPVWSRLGRREGRGAGKPRCESRERGPRAGL